jgi:hypothetical protein
MNADVISLRRGVTSGAPHVVISDPEVIRRLRKKNAEREQLTSGESLLLDQLLAALENAVMVNPPTTPLGSVEVREHGARDSAPVFAPSRVDFPLSEPDCS